MLKRADSYEIMRAEDVGQDSSNQIRLGRHSGRAGFFGRLVQLGLEFQSHERDRLYERFMLLADQKREVYDEDLRNLVQNNQRPVSKPHFRLQRIAVNMDSNGEPQASVEIVHAKTDATVQRGASGDGPVDALYRAINQAVGSAHELANYTIRSVTEGADAVGEVTVLVSHAGAYFRGTAQSTDVLHSSAAAYIDALNQLEAYREDEESQRFVGDGIMNSFDGTFA